MLRHLALLIAMLLSAGCLPESPQQHEAPPFGSRTVQPAVAGSEVAPYLAPCLYETAYRNPPMECTLDQLPFLAQRAPDLDVNLVMEHVVVEKQWMAARFREVLEALPSEFLQLFRSTTGVVIAGDIRPSRYRAVSGAIYLDPAYLWLSQQEFLDTPQFPDYRSNFGDDLQFRTVWRYVIESDYAYRSGRSFYNDRRFEEVLLGMAALLAHELAHAADYVPPLVAATAHPRHTVADAVRNGMEYRTVCSPDCSRQWVPPISGILADAYPLQSESLSRTAAIRFHGRSARSEDIALTPEDIAAEFSVDRASDHYNYSTVREDVAMLFEELLTSYFFGLRRDLAVVDNPLGEGVTGADYTVFWGQRGRIADPNVVDRAFLVAQHVLPELDIDALREALPAPVQMVAGRNWIENLDLDASGRLKLTTDPVRWKRLLESHQVEDDRLPRGTVLD